jgi:hypothetical protein
MRQRQSFIHSVSIDDHTYDLKDDDQLVALEHKFSKYFGHQAQIWDLIEAYDNISEALTLESLGIFGRSTDVVETRAIFRHAAGTKTGSCIYYWRKMPDGSLERIRDAEINIQGSRARLSLQIHANMVIFARRMDNVQKFQVEVRQIGRYAFRFLHGVNVDEKSRRELGRELDKYCHLFGVPFCEQAFFRVKSPRDIADFIILEKVTQAWMDHVDAIIERQGYDFTINQVVDVVRRPGLALLLDMPSYLLSLDLKNDDHYHDFLESVRLGRSRKTLRRMRGLFGVPFQQLPKPVRNSLIVYRPYVFPRPWLTPRVPDLSSLADVKCPYEVTGFRSSDGVFLDSQPVDQMEAKIRDYRAQEVQQVINSIEQGIEIVTVTGLSGSGKTEVVTWQLENLLSSMGIRVVSLDAMKLAQYEAVGELLLDIDNVVRPMVTIFDESLYIKGDKKSAFLNYAHRFLKWPDQHLVLVGGGLLSPEGQKNAIHTELEDLFVRYKHDHVSLYPKPLNPGQAYRFLGLGRAHWLDENQKIELLDYVLKRYPHYFIPFVPIRFHEHPELSSLEQAKQLVDDNILPDEWRQLAGMLFE